ncbi:MAG: cobalamin-dependent protein [Rhodobacteraceae bacterium]|nr:cobalamin-dependent protein [Paracoccaceae bacterium]
MNKRRTETADVPGLDRDNVARVRDAIEAVRTTLPQDSVNTLAREVLSRLAGRAQGTRSSAQRPISLVEALLQNDDLAVMRIVSRLIARGEPIEDVYLVHLAGAARELGAMWNDDRLPSQQVTLAAGRIYSIMRGISPHLKPAAQRSDRHAVFAPVPGNRHILGVKMVADLFRHDGWQIDLLLCRTHEELICELSKIDYGLLGISVATRGDLAGATRLASAVRVTAPHVRILLSGAIVQIEPDIARLCDADAVATDFESARRELEELRNA